MLRPLLKNILQSLIKCMHLGHFLASQHRHLKIYTGDPPTPAAQLNGSLSCSNNQLDCHVVILCVYMTPIDSSKALWEIPSFFKTMHNLHHLISSGNFDVLCQKYIHYCLETSWTISQAVDTPIPKRCKIILYSMLVPSLHIAIATPYSTGIAARTVLECCKHLLKSEHKC